MHETSFSYSDLDSLTTAAERAAGWHRLRGWVWPKAGRHFADVRARLAGRVFPGVHGYVRASLPLSVPVSRSPILAGFHVDVELPPGTIDVELEVLEIEGRWTPFQTVQFQVASRTEDSTPAPHRTPVLWHDFCRSLDLLLRLRRNRPEASWFQLATGIAANLPVVQDLLPPIAPFIGHADEPAMVNSSRFGLVPVVGYMFHSSQTLPRMWVTADLLTLQPLKLGRATPNLVPHFPQFPAAAAAGYEGHVDVPSSLPNPVSVRIYAELPDRSLHLAQVRLTWRHDAELEKSPYAGSSVDDFDAALAAWRSALRIRGRVVVQDPQFDASVAVLRQRFAQSLASSQATPPVAGPEMPGRPLSRIILASHNLNLEGAPLFLLDLARHFAAQGISLTVVSASDGVLRARFAACGAKILIVDPGAVFRAPDGAAARAAIAQLGQACNFANADLVITNTFTTFWAVLAAKAAGQRVLSYVHESTSPAVFYRDDLHPEVLALVDAALVAADAVSFTSDATRRYHAWPSRPIHAALTPGWVDLPVIDAWRAANPREELRARFNLRPGELLVTNVGTICDRKGQLGFAAAVDIFNRRHPDLAARVRFVLLGGRQTRYDEILRDVLAGLKLPNLFVHQETPDFLAYYAAADLTVCSSHEESSPRVVFEAMACGTPLLASDIAGISEIARDGLEATLVPAGDAAAWAEALARLLQSPQIGQTLAARARARIEAQFTSTIVLPAHTALARTVAAGQFR